MGRVASVTWWLNPTVMALALLSFATIKQRNAIGKKLLDWENLLYEKHYCIQVTLILLQFYLGNLDSVPIWKKNFF